MVTGFTVARKASGMNGLTAVVTGATRGIGVSVARRFAADGADVVVSGRNAEVVRRTVAAIEEAGGSVTGVRADVRDEFDLERLMEVASRFGDRGIDVVVANAGVYHGEAGRTPLSEESYAAFDDTLRTNARGVFATVRESLPHLDADARVLIPTGTVAREHRSGYGTYAVSKAAVEAVMRGYAADLDQTVGCLDPGVVATDLTGGRGRDPDTIAGMFAWAATDVPAVDLDGRILDVAAWQDATGEE